MVLLLMYSGKENLADYQSKDTRSAHHQSVRHWYLHEPNSVRELPRASKPSTLKGCVGPLPDEYLKSNPLPQVPTRQSVPTGKIRLPTYFKLPIWIPTLHRMVGPTIARARIPW